MSQTVHYRNGGFKDVKYLIRALEKLGYTVRQQGQYHYAERSNYYTNLWFQEPAPTQSTEDIVLHYDGDFHRDLEQICGRDFNRLKQQYRIEGLIDGTQHLQGEFYHTELADGTLDIKLTVDI